MKLRFFWALLPAIALIAPQAADAGVKGRGLASAKFVSVYSNVRDKEKCKYSEGFDENGRSLGQSYTCAGPVEGIETYLGTGDDWDVFNITLGGKTYATWEFMVKVGSFAGFGNDKGLVEWVGRPGGRGFTNPTALIIRFNGVIRDGEATRSRLFVFGLENDVVCYKGMVATNEAARKVAYTGACKETLPLDSN